MEIFATWLVDTVQGLGYIGLFTLMFFGNVLVPIPVETILIPAGYLVQQGEMSLPVVILSAVAGDICGSLVAYYLAFFLGRKFLYRYGKYLFFTHERIEKLDKFFASHGQISVLTGRLIPGLRHFMAFPAGLSHMHLKRFVVYTGTGGGIWILTLIGVGYLIGGNKELVRHYMPYIEAGVIIGVITMVFVYVWHHRRQLREKINGMA